MNHVGVDFESTFTDTRDIKKLGASAYLRHPETDVYLVSVFGDGVEYVGHPRNAPWEQIADRPWVAHNRSFDSEVAAVLRERGLPIPVPPEWHCSSDMAAYLQVKRDLGAATRVLEGVLLKKSTRSKMKNQTWEGMTPAFREETLAYALDDAKASWLLWENHSHQFPEHERRLSEHTTLMCRRGLTVDYALAQRNIDWLRPALELVLKDIPWVGELDAKGKPVKTGSIPRLRKECETLKVPFPESTDVKSEQFQDWVDEYASSAPFVAAIQQWRRVTRFLNLSEGLIYRSVEGRFRYGMKYGGACHTMRFAGDEGWNIQNPPKEPYAAMELASRVRPGLTVDEQRAWLSSAGVDPDSTADIRGCLIPAPGHKFITADLSQIEPRVLAYLAGQHKLLDLMRTGMDVYEAQARSMDLYSDPGKLKIVNPGLRQTVKVLNLGLGFGLAEKGLMRSYRRMSGEQMPASRAVELVELYRSKNPEVAGVKVGNYYQGGLWGTLRDICRKASWTDGRVNFELPSGRTIRYWDVRNDPTEGVLCVTERGSSPKHCWHGRSTENCLAGDTPVLTDSGWKPIEFVLPADLLWDGVEWVSHAGVIDNGEQETLTCHGVACTPDHLILSIWGWEKAEDACVLAQGMLSSSHAEEALANLEHRGSEVWNCDGAPAIGYGRNIRAMGSPMRLRPDLHSEGRRTIPETWKGHPDLRSCLSPLQDPRFRKSSDARNVKASCLCRMEIHAGQMRDSDAPSVPQLRSPGNNSVPRVAVLRDFLEGHGSYLQIRFGLRSSRQQLRIPPGELQMVHPVREREEHTEVVGESGVSARYSGRSESARGEADHSVLPSEAWVGLGNRGNKARVYDIRDCGPRHRFTVLGNFPMIVHNCVQGTARDAFAPMILRCEDDGIPAVMHAHDELTCEVPEDRAEEAREHVTRVMSTSPEWAPGLPVMGVAGIHDMYEKD